MPPAARKTKRPKPRKGGSALPSPESPTPASASAPEDIPKSEVTRTKGTYNFTTDDVQTYYDVKLIGGMTPDEAARVTGVKFGLSDLKVNPAGDLQLPDDLPDKEFPDAFAPEGGAAGDDDPDTDSAGTAPAPRRSEKPDKQPAGAKKSPQGKDIKDISPDAEPEPAAPNTQDTPESTDPVTAFIMENPEFNDVGFTTYCARHPEADTLALAEAWWADQYRALHESSPYNLVPAFVDLFEQAMHEIATTGVHDPAHATALTIAEYKRLGGVFLSEAQWASKAFKNPGFWKKNAPFGHKDKPFTDPSVPMSAILQTARKHPGKERGTLGFTQAVLNLKQAKPETVARLEQIKGELQKALQRKADRRDTAVTRTKQQFA